MRQLDSMITLHVTIVGDRAVLPRAEFGRLVELAGQSEPIRIRTCNDDRQDLRLMRLAEEGGSLDWLTDEPDLYTVDDLKVRYR